MRRPLTIEHIAAAIESLRMTRTRTLLTTLGITIGIASVTSILILSTGLSSVISQQITDLGDNLIVVRPSSPARDLNSIAAPIAQQGYSTSTLSEQDYTNISKLNGVEAVAPIMTINGSPRNDKTVVANSVIVATSPSFIETTPLSVADGDFIDSVTTKNTAVIGRQLAIDLFGTEIPMGQTFTLRGQTFTVIGVLKPTHSPINFNNVDFDHAIIMSLESGKSLHQGIAQIQQINIKAKNGTNITQVADKVKDQLLRSHDNEPDFTLVTGQDIAKPTSKFFQSVSAVMAVIAAISLVVGGIGIMNIMLVGVAERTREIGLRKAVGASNANIIAQFLCEALIISIIGGVFGIILGYLIALGIGSFIMLIPPFHWIFIIAGIGVAILIGLVFGFYPAWKASRKDPIESLRQYH